MQRDTDLTARQVAATAPEESPRDGQGDSQREGPRGGLRRFLRLVGLGSDESSLRESLEEVIEEHDEGAHGGGALGENEREMLRNVLRYGDLRIEDAMVPRADIVAVEASVPFRELVNIMAGAAHSRLPVYRETLDEVVGMVHVKDVIRIMNQGDGNDAVTPESLRRPVLFVPPSMKLMDVLARMRSGRTHMAIVVDEYGGTDGLVTIEDLVEEIVGDIEDEYDRAPEALLVDQGEGIYEADARIPVPDLEQVLGCDLLPDERDEDIETLGGLVVSLEGRVPEPGESISHPMGYRFEILEGDKRRLVRLRIHAPESAQDGGGSD